MSKEVKKRNTRLKGRILSSLRKLTWSWEPINNAQNKAKVAPATFECASCGKWCYTGKSDKNLVKLQEEHPKKNVQMEKICRDHIDPIFEITDDFVFSWDTIIERMFCESEGIQIICKTCHDEKTKEENKQRKELRK